MNKREKNKLKKDFENEQENGINSGFGLEDFDILEEGKQNFPIVDTKRNQKKKGGGFFGL
jgi:hypothetical protein